MTDDDKKVNFRKSYNIKLFQWDSINYITGYMTDQKIIRFYDFLIVFFFNLNFDKYIDIKIIAFID